MNVMTTGAERIQTLPVEGRRLWAGLLLAPSAWLIAEVAGYYMASRSCEVGTPGLPLESFAAPRVAQVVLVGLTLLAAFAGLAVAIGSWRALSAAAAAAHEELSRAGSPAMELGRARFMALAGVLVSVLFAGGLVLFGISAFLVNACSQAR
jgi:hypothetical protein